MVVGADPFAIERLWRNVYGRGYSQRPDLSLMGVLSGIEMALWDIIGKALGQPIYQLLGGKAHERLRSYTYLYPREEGGEQAHSPSRVYDDPDTAATRALDYLAMGFTAVKFDPAGAYSTYDPRQPGLEQLDYIGAVLQAHTRGGGFALRSLVRYPRPVHDLRGGPDGEAPRDL